MLGWMNKKSSAHPMADEKGAKAFLAELPADDPHKTLQELSFWLDATRSAEGLKPQRAFEIISLLDQAGKTHQRRLATEYLAGGGRLQRFQEARIWTSVVEFWRQLGAAYQHCMASTQGSGALKPLAPVIAARAIRAHALELKWTLLRYGPVDPTLWGSLGVLYAPAEAAGYATKSCTVYPGPFGDSTVQREYLKALTLAISATDTLLPRHLEIAERIVAQSADRFILQPQAVTGCQYFIDLQVAKPPARMVAKFTPSASVRYFGPGDAGAALEKLAVSVASSGAVPGDLNLGASYEPSMVVEVLKHLARYWAATPPARGETRKRAFARMHVVHDFDDVVSIIAGESTDLDFQANIETWTVENESQHGYGATIPQTGGDWIRVGALLGIKLAEGNSWSVAVVRRLNQGPNQQRYVGVQALAKGGARVKLHTLNARDVASAESDDAVLLPSSAADASGMKEVNLLMRLGTFSPRQSFLMRAYERDYLLMPKQLVEGGQDFDLARFRIMQKQG